MKDTFTFLSRVARGELVDQFCKQAMLMNWRVRDVEILEDTVKRLKLKNGNSHNGEAASSASDNTGSPKLPTLDECNFEVQSKIWSGSITGDSFGITKIVYDFISRQLSGNA